MPEAQNILAQLDSIRAYVTQLFDDYDMLQERMLAQSRRIAELENRLAVKEGA